MKNIIIVFVLALCIISSCQYGVNNTKSSLINTSKVINDDSIKIAAIAKTYESRYEIVGTDHNNAVDNFYVLINNIPIDKDTLQDFATTFRIVHKSNRSNINMIDDREIYPTILEYPLEGKKYIKVADHLVAFSDFSGYTNLYPLQDSFYKEQGGKNWKIKAIP